MGIENLIKLIKTVSERELEDGRELDNNVPIRSYKFSKFKGLVVAVDASLLIHQTVIAMRSSGHDMKNKKGELTSHLNGLFFKILIFLQNQIKPIFVFDGIAPDIKRKTIAKRLARKVAAQKKMADIDDSEDETYIKLSKQTFRPTKENIDEARILLDLMGIPYINAPEEADPVLAWLGARRYVDLVCSDDSDMLPLGAPYLAKDMLKFMSKNKPVTVVSLRRTKVKMNLDNQAQFIDLCVLLGTDYCDNIKGIGYIKAYKYITKYKTLENVLAAIHKERYGESSDSNDSNDSNNSNDSGKSKDSNSSEDTPEKQNEKCMLEAQKYFSTALERLDQSDNFVITDDNIKLRKFQYKELMDFMCVKHNFDVSRIENGVARLRKYYSELNVDRPNTKVVHQIIKKENYVLKALTSELEFLPSENTTSTSTSSSSSTSREISWPNKKTQLKNNLTSLQSNLQSSLKSKVGSTSKSSGFDKSKPDTESNCSNSSKSSGSNTDSDMTLSDFSINSDDVSQSN